MSGVLKPTVLYILFIFGCFGYKTQPGPGYFIAAGIHEGNA